METALITGLVNLGGLALLAVFIFYFYRIDRNDTINKLIEITKAEIECRNKESESRRELATALNHQTEVLASLKTIVEHSSRVNTSVR